MCAVRGRSFEKTFFLFSAKNVSFFGKRTVCLKGPSKFRGLNECCVKNLMYARKREIETANP